MDSSEDFKQASYTPNSAEDPLETSPSVAWTASEFVSHSKGASWYLILAMGVIVATAIVFFVTGQDIVSSVVVLMAGAAFGAFGARKPRVLDYSIDHSGIHIHNKSFSFSSLKSFSLEDDGAVMSIFLTPVKRLAPGISMYFPPEQEQQILDTLGSYLPHEERPADRVEKLMRKVRF